MEVQAGTIRGAVCVKESLEHIDACLGEHGCGAPHHLCILAAVYSAPPGSLLQVPQP
jgi:hypothetical protein